MVGMAWWAYEIGTTLRAQLMKAATAPLKDAQPIRVKDHDDVAGEDDIISMNKSLKSRAFIEGNSVTLYMMNIVPFEERADIETLNNYPISVEVCLLMGL